MYWYILTLYTQLFFHLCLFELNLLYTFLCNIMLHILFHYIVRNCDNLRYLWLKQFDGLYEDAQSSKKIWNYTLSAVTA